MTRVIEDNGNIIIDEDEKQFLEFLSNEEFIHYVGMISPPRPGVVECITLLEHKHYIPKTPRNELFIMRIIEWRGIMWSLVSIPLKEKEFMEKVADECGLRIANGVPTMIGHGGVQSFPANNERVFTLENKSDHPVYRNDPDLTQKILKAEFENLKRMHSGK